MAKPTTTPAWAEGATASISVPGAVKIALGWVLSERPSHAFHNWWMNLVGEWLQYLTTNAPSRYVSIDTFITDRDEGEYGLIGPSLDVTAFAPWSDNWTKTKTELGVGGGPVEHIATCGDLVYVASKDAGVQSYITCFAAYTGVLQWTIDLGAVDFVDRLISDGTYVIAIIDNGGAKVIKIYDRTDGTLEHSFALANAADIIADGQALYACTTTHVYAYTNYWDNGTIATAWSDDASARGLGALAAIGTNGGFVYAGGTNNTKNFVTYEGDGTFSYTAILTNAGSAGTAITRIIADTERLFIGIGADGFIAWPSAQRKSTGGTLPNTHPSAAAMTQMGDFNGSGGDVTPVIHDVNGRYLVATASTGMAISVKPTSGGGAYLSVCCVDSWDAAIVTAILTPTHCIIGGDDSSNTVLRCIRLPQNGGRIVRKIDPTTNENRAPMWGVVQEIEA